MVDVVIAGGGIAGSSCAIALAQRGYQVVLIEKDTEPRHKLCGEFLSGEVASKFDDLGILDVMLEQGAVPIRSSVITTLSGTSTSTPIPGRALGLSRFALDNLLLNQAVQSGVTLVNGAVTDIIPAIDRSRVIHTRGEVEARVSIGAYGRRTTLDRKLERKFLERRYPYVAFKTHVAGIDTEDRVELFAFDGGYCGMSLVEENRTNVCWIMHSDVLRAAGGSPENVWKTVLPTNQALGKYLQSGTRVMDFFSASQLFFTDKKSAVNGTLMIGDSAGMIAPLAGDGMAMAIDSALLAASHVGSFINGNTSRDDMEIGYARSRKRMFRIRMATARLLHGAIVRPRIANLAVPAIAAIPGITNGLVKLTRGR